MLLLSLSAKASTHLLLDIDCTTKTASAVVPMGCCCSVPQLNTLRVTRYVHPHLYKYTAYYWVRILRARPFSITPLFRQPHSVFGGYSWVSTITVLYLVEVKTKG